MVKDRRIEYIDAMKGMTMLLVVYGHILYFGYGEKYFFNSWQFNNVLMLFRMPLFFFVSGFLLYKAGFLWNFPNSWNFIKKKFRVQVIPTLFWGGLFGLFFSRSLLDMCCVYDKGGYWFTWALFEYFFLYMGLQLFFHYIHLSLYVRYFIWLLAAVFIYILSIPCVEDALNISSSRFVGLLGLIEFRYYIYFLLGALARKYYNMFLCFLEYKHTLTVAFLLFICFFLYMRVGGMFHNTLIDELYYMTSAVVGIIVVISLFRKYEEYVTKQTRIGQMLQYIGTRTLDVYLLHYFFLPRGLYVLGDFFNVNRMPAIEFFISLLFSIMVIIVTLVVSQIVRLSPFWGHYLLGMKR